ncbi:pyridoxal phosphate-dependent aminotransferase [Actinoplanes sp. HUAS TT8]|uniref:pyridoxal phosphate-dependent aminotransferase n=1 Tax=Actinoplanes sp. HUAS TT8 TaxID=3447453 RepID=UPI003F520568
MTDIAMSRTVRQDLPDGTIDLAGGDVRMPFPHPEVSSPLLGPDDQPYPPTAGSRELRELIAAATEPAAVTAEQVLVTPGARAAVFLTLLRASGRDVLLPTPRWGSYPALTAMAGARPVSYGPYPHVDALDEARTAATALVVINSPRNPDGTVVDAATITAVLAWAQQHHITVLFDQVYRGVTAHPAPSPLDTAGPLPQHCVIVDGLTKSHAAAGLRIGWAITADLHQLTATASHLIGGVGTRAQQAAVAVLRQPPGPRQQALADLAARTRAAAAQLDRIPGVSCPVPDAGFFLFPDLHGWLADTDVASWLREHHRVAVVDGAAFAAPGRIRVSTAVPDHDLTTGLRRLTAALSTRP